MSGETAGVSVLRDRDIRDLLLGALPTREMRDRLAPAARLAGERLELVRPALLGMAPDGLHCGMVADVPTGGIVIMIADAERSAAMTVMTRASAVSTMQMWADCVIAAEHHRPSGITWRENLASMFSSILDHFGQRPGETQRPNREVNMLLLGGLFGVFSRRHLARLSADVDGYRESGRCPALVGLIGPATSGTPGLFCIGWPILLSLGQYAELAVRHIAGTPCDA